MNEKAGITQGPLFRNSKGKRSSTAELDILLHAILERVQRKWESVIPDSVKVKEEFSVYRSLRREERPLRLRTLACHKKLSKPITGGENIRGRAG